ncbi:autoinducer-2 (AI-2) modifying protein LsrG [Salmonella enterica subsp. enterica]|uniref:Autoinducer-2 (AI-2) modifying protein LsrG n=1 Tax=Salmonella enterica I TaxID=59201 RepID=A0A379WI81_SALET|nr:autoinducer-2 (AI-2) modifying protein LsrG [Salmonella enterica subsp. enterica]
MTVILFGIIRGLMMHVTLVEINVHDDKVEQFIDVFRQNHLGSIKEPGNLRFDVLQDPQVPTRFYIYEAYVDEEAVAFSQDNATLQNLRGAA